MVISFDEKGWRGLDGQDFDEAVVARIADAVGAFWSERYPGSLIVVGYDTRLNSYRYARRAASILSSWGLNVKVSDVECPLPALAFAVANDTRAAGGFMVSGSGSPAAYNGVVLRNNFGAELTQDEIAEIEKLIPSDAPEVAGTVEEIDIMTAYLADIASYVDVDLIAQAHLKILIDPMFGCARDCLAHLLGSMGVDVIEIHGEDSQDFGGIQPRPAEPWIDECERAAVNLGVDAGFALDGDADRAGAVDSTGHFVGPYRMAALIATHLIEDKGLDGRIAAPLSGSSYMRRLSAKLGFELTSTPIGFSWQVQEMLKSNVLMATDSFGGIALPTHLYERDGLLAILLLVEMMAYRKQNMDELVADLNSCVGTMEYASRDLRVDAAQFQVIKNLLPGYNPERIADRAPTMISHGDGMRAEFDDGSWVMVRPSRKTGLMRLYAEAETREKRDAMIHDCSRLVSQITVKNL